jgi:hypothetical protein
VCLGRRGSPGLPRDVYRGGRRAGAGGNGGVGDAAAGSAEGGGASAAGGAGDRVAATAGGGLLSFYVDEALVLTGATLRDLDFPEGRA